MNHLSCVKMILLLIYERELLFSEIENFKLFRSINL